MNKDEFKPYVPADKITPEFTVTSIVMGIILAVVFGAANADLGLRVGMTVSASIPAAVISMGVIRVILKKDSILESNMVQTIGSAGESLAAGAIFTLPVLFLWAKDGVVDSPSMVTIALIALCGGVLGVLFMVPLRNALIVKEHGVLPYPEGTACAEVLLAGEEGGASANTVFWGMGLASLFKFLVDGLKVIPGVITIPVKSFKTEFSAEVYPALLGVGYICGAKIASYMFAGGLLGWFVLIPAIITFGGDTVLYPGTDTIANIYAANGASAIWSSYIRYIGAGAVAAGGIISLIKSLPLIVTTFRDAIKSMKGSKAYSSLRTERDIDMRFIGIGVAAMIIAIWLLPQIPVTLLGAVLVLWEVATIRFPVWRLQHFYLQRLHSRRPAMAVHTA
jgi:putative OPT family oligopeptide transporter